MVQPHGRRRRDVTVKLISSSAVGILWTLASPLAAFALAAALMPVGTLAFQSQVNGASFNG